MSNQNRVGKWRKTGIFLDLQSCPESYVDILFVESYNLETSISGLGRLRQEAASVTDPMADARF